MIDWSALAAAESRIPSQDIDILTSRLHKLLALEQKMHNEGVVDGNAPELISMDTVQYLVSPESTEPSPWKDIPRLEYGDYRDDELELWHALINDYCGTLLKIPKYVSSSIWSGVPPALRGRVWQTLAGIDSVEMDTLQSLYNSLVTEWTPSVKIIGRDLNRTFPGISLFREKDGDGQRMLGRVMRAYSAYDIQVGYCQGLTFLAGPLLLHMDDKSAFCILVKLMEDFDLRSMFTADMAGLHLRVYQFERLIEDQLPQLYQHFTNLEINLLCTAQWFLSMFAVTCPLDMLVRIYDVIFAEGAIVTLMRTAIAVLKRNEADLCDFTNEEDVQYRLLSAALWDVFDYDADMLMRDIRAVSAEDIVRGLDQAKYIYNEKTASLARKESSAKKRLSMKRMGSTRKHKFQLSLHKPLLPIVVPSSEQHEWSPPSSSTSSSSSLPGSRMPAASRSSTSISHSPPSPPPESNGLTNLSRSGSIMSSVSSHGTVATSVTSFDENELQRTKSNLECERHERQVDREIIETLLMALPADIMDSEDSDISSAIDLLRTRFRLGDYDSHSKASSRCKNCERLMLDLASAKVREAALRVKIDELEDKLGLASSQEAEVKSDNKQQRWGFWGHKASA